MKERILSNKNLFIAGLILLAATARLIPHYPNFTPIAAIALFGGANFDNKKMAFLVPFIAMLLSDLVIGFHSTMIPVYLSFVAIVGIGIALQSKIKVGTVAVASLSSSILFFVVTNFGAWLSMGFYPKTAAGLFESYIAAIPFFGYTIFGDLAYSAILFGVYSVAKLKLPVLVSE